MYVRIPKSALPAASALAAVCAVAGCGSGSAAAPHPADAAPSTVQASPTAVTCSLALQPARIRRAARTPTYADASSPGWDQRAGLAYRFYRSGDCDRL